MTVAVSLSICRGLNRVSAVVCDPHKYFNGVNGGGGTACNNHYLVGPKPTVRVNRMFHQKPKAKRRPTDAAIRCVLCAPVRACSQVSDDVAQHLPAFCRHHRRRRRALRSQTTSDIFGGKRRGSTTLQQPRAGRR